MKDTGLRYLDAALSLAKVTDQTAICILLEEYLKLHSMIQSQPVARKRRRPNVPAANAGRNWSPEQDQELLGMWAAAYTTKEIAKRLGRSPGAIRLRLQALNRLTA